MSASLPTTGIPYADRAWNVVTGCTAVSAGCDHCWAQRMLSRRLPMMGHDPDGPAVQVHPERLDQPLHTWKPSVVFVAPIGDLFHEDVPEKLRQAVCHAMFEERRHTYLILTKRPQNMGEFARELRRYGTQPFQRVWLGVSVEDQATADERLPILAGIDWPNKWVSVEPMLGRVDTCNFPVDTGWVVCGCESGPGARRFDEDWARTLRDQCWTLLDGRGGRKRVPFYYKQAPDPARRGSVVTHPLLDGRTWTETPWGGGAP